MTDKEKITKLLQAVGSAASVFRHYEAKHRRKGTSEGNLKAEMNAREAERLERVVEEVTL